LILDPDLSLCMTQYTLRPLGSRQGALHRADGSCQWKQGATEVIVGVWGPKETPSRFEHLDKTDLQVVVMPATGMQSTYTTTLERHIKKVFQEHILLMLNPRTQIVIVIQILYDDGSILSACCNATALALLDAGVPLRSMVVSVDLVVTKDSNLILDPDSKQQDAENVRAILSFQISIDGAIVSERSSLPELSGGFIPLDSYWTARELAKKASTKLLSFVKLTTTAKCLYECHGTAF